MGIEKQPRSNGLDLHCCVSVYNVVSNCPCNQCESVYYVQLLDLCIIMCPNQSEVVDKCAIVVSVYNVVFMQPMQPKDRT